jgi:hypothetical protein
MEVQVLWIHHDRYAVASCEEIKPRYSDQALVLVAAASAKG